MTNKFVLVSPGSPVLSGPPLPDAKTISTLAAQFALIGRELSVITKAGHRHFEIRRLGQCHARSTEADLHGLLRQIRATAE